MSIELLHLLRTHWTGRVHRVMDRVGVLLEDHAGDKAAERWTSATTPIYNWVTERQCVYLMGCRGRRP